MDVLFEEGATKHSNSLIELDYQAHQKYPFRTHKNNSRFNTIKTH